MREARSGHAADRAPLRAGVPPRLRLLQAASTGRPPSEARKVALTRGGSCPTSDALIAACWRTSSGAGRRRSTVRGVVRDSVSRRSAQWPPGGPGLLGRIPLEQRPGADRDASLDSSPWPCIVRSREHNPSGLRRPSDWPDATCGARPRARGTWPPGRSRARPVTPRCCPVLKPCRQATPFRAASAGTWEPYATSSRSQNRLARHVSSCVSAGSPSASADTAGRHRAVPDDGTQSIRL
jgi:hypothetical protein